MKVSDVANVASSIPLVMAIILPRFPRRLRRAIARFPSSRLHQTASHLDSNCLYSRLWSVKISYGACLSAANLFHIQRDTISLDKVRTVHLHNVPNQAVGISGWAMAASMWCARGGPFLRGLLAGNTKSKFCYSKLESTLRRPNPHVHVVYSTSAIQEAPLKQSEQNSCCYVAFILHNHQVMALVWLIHICGRYQLRAKGIGACSMGICVLKCH